MSEPILVLAGIQPVSRKRVFGERPKTLQHLWLVPRSPDQADPRYLVFRPTVALCGWKQSRRREAPGEVTSAEAVVRAVLDAGFEWQPDPRMPWRTWRARRDACRELGWCISCVLRLLAPSCKHEDCQEHPDLALACMLERSHARPPREEVPA